MKHSNKYRSFFLLFFLMLIAGGCLPKSREIGTIVMAPAPVVFLVGLLLELIYLKLWKKHLPDLTLNRKVLKINFFFLSLASLLVIISNQDLVFADNSNPFYLGLLTFGPSYLTLLLVLNRIWLYIKPKTAFTGPQIGLTLFYIAPSFYLAMQAPNLPSWLRDWFIFVYLIPGFYGIALGIFVVLFLLELKFSRPPNRISLQKLLIIAILISITIFMAEANPFDF